MIETINRQAKLASDKNRLLSALSRLYYRKHQDQAGVLDLPHDKYSPNTKIPQKDLAVELGYSDERSLEIVKAVDALRIEGMLHTRTMDCDGRTYLAIWPTDKGLEHVAR